MCRLQGLRAWECGLGFGVQGLGSGVAMPLLAKKQPWHSILWPEPYLGADPGWHSNLMC